MKLFNDPIRENPASRAIGGKLPPLRPVRRLRRDGRYALHPGVRLRREKTRILLYTKDPEIGTLSGRHSFLHPRGAVMLCLFDGKKTLNEVELELAYLLGAEQRHGLVGQGIRIALRRLMEHFPELLVHGDPPVRGHVPSYVPHRLLISNDDVDLHASAVLDAPLDFSLSLNVRCNRRCIYCYADRDAPEPPHLSLERLKELVDEAAGMQVGSIGLGGGDPLLHPDILELTAYTLRRGYIPYISTKQYVDDERAKAFAATGLPFMQLSIDSLDPEIADEMVGTKGYLHGMLASLRAIRRAGMAVRVKAVVTSRNIDTLGDFLEGLHRRGVRSFLLDTYGRTLFRHHDGLFPTNEKVRRFLPAVAEFRKRHPRAQLMANVGLYDPPLPKQKTAIWERRSSCSAGRTGLSVLPDGKVSVCDRCPVSPEFIIGDVSTSSLAEAWHAELLRRFVEPSRTDLAEPCRSCTEFEECRNRAGRCFRDVYLATGAVNGADPKCPKVALSIRY